MTRNLIPVLSVCMFALNADIAVGQRVGERTIEITQLDVSDFAVNHEITIYFKVKDQSGNPSAV